MKRLLFSFCNQARCASLRRRIWIVLALTLSLTPHQSHSQELTSKLLGGSYITLTQSAVALIMTSTFRCSGVLVGPQYILTAAHCVVMSNSAADYRVIVAGGIHTVEQRWFHPTYNHGGAVILNSPFDLGILKLSQPVTGIKPIPILMNDRVTSGENAKLYGYGTNESSGTSGRAPWANAKVGGIVISSSLGGLLTGNQQPTGTSACAGDSGGPAIQTVPGGSAVVGITSAGVNGVENGNCTLMGDGEFLLVDVQSSASQSFLSRFKGIQYLFKGQAAALGKVERAKVKLAHSLNVTDLAAYQREVTSVSISLKGVLPLFDRARATILRGVLNELRLALSQKELAPAISFGRRGLLRLNRFSTSR